jgi:hypothetical protein
VPAIGTSSAAIKVNLISLYILSGTSCSKGGYFIIDLNPKSPIETLAPVL